MPLGLVLGVFAITLLGVVLWLWARRGRRIGTSPTCRWCNFDVAGSWPASPTCPECGAGLKRPGAIMTGQRRPRPVALTLAYLMMAAGAASIAGCLFVVIAGAELNKHKPLGVLLWEAQNSSEVNALGALKEILLRAQSSQLDEIGWKRVISAALEEQAALDKPWNFEWGNLIETGRLADKVTKADLARYLDQAFVPTLEHRTTFVAGEPITALIRLKESRVGLSETFTVATAVNKARIDGKPLYNVNDVASTNPFEVLFGQTARVQATIQAGYFALAGPRANGRYAGYSMQGLQLATSKGIAPGKHTLSFELWLNSDSQGHNAWPDIPWSASPTLANRVFPKRAFEFEIECLPPGTPAAKPIEPTGELASKLKPLLEFSTLSGYTYDERSARRSMQVTGTLRFKDKLPVPLAAMVHVEYEGKSYPLSELSSGKTLTPSWEPDGGSGARSFYGSIPSGLAGKKVSLVLVPSVNAAASTIDVLEYFDGELEFKDIQIEETQRLGVPQAGGLLSFVRWLSP